MSTSSGGFFTALDLLRRAAAYKGLKLREGASRACSEPIKTYFLDSKLLAVLAERGIKKQPRPDCNYQVFTLVDENPQEKFPGWAPSNYWNFKPLDNGRGFDLRVTLSVHLSISVKSRGIVLVPEAYGSFVSPADRLPNFRMFKALVENDDAAPDIAKELAASDGSIVVTWTDLGLGGIRRIADLFNEFAGQNETVKRLAWNEEIFNPVPYPRYQKPSEELFVAEPVQPKILRTWRQQLDDYRTRLVLP
jgi:hypothetical protein